jgi:hypothetical protein
MLGEMFKDNVDMLNDMKILFSRMNTTVHLKKVKANVTPCEIPDSVRGVKTCPTCPTSLS